MRKLDKVLAGMLALALSAACAGPRQERSGDAALPSDRDRPAGDAFVSEARQALNDLNEEFLELDAQNSRLQGAGADTWAESREEIVRARQALATDLDRLGGASTENAEEVRARVAQNVETMTHHVERASLLAADGQDEFVTAAREHLAEVDRDIESLRSHAARLPMDAREEASQSVEDLRSQANDVRETVASMADLAPQEIAEQREDVADDVAALSASVQRESFELQADLEP